MTPKNKWKIILPLIIIAVLAVAFYIGGNAPGSQGWSVGNDGDVSHNAAVGNDVSAGDDASGNQPAGPDAVVAGDPDVSGDPDKDVPEQTDGPDGEPDSTLQAAAGDKSDNDAQSEVQQPAKDPAKDTAGEVKDEPVMVIDPETGKDRYQTDPVPEGKPVPVEPQDVTIGSTAYSCTISINCATILDNISYCDPEKVELVPEDGWILEPMTVTFYEGESVFNVLQRVCKQQKIHMEYEDTPIYNSAYIEGIHNIYEFDVGELSGWMYKVNEWFPNYGSSRYQLQDGDVICWEYTCDLGNDIGGGYSAGNRSA
ncbi:MAG: DUF4430 domain-containing protein [Firmicutes bacterium]|nr:DUF4430 domain-containing protein [Bacillota bacterium]